ncbi:hypothetical protein GRJ2_003182500 [Grus japonensis]|uniref:RNase H type-1 domain-containing protein n=1 Tax=Grus japonensis TaxID=30415 RepID=A0ABC9YC05_GRUJA
MPAGSKMDPPLAKAKPISASVITYLRRKTKELKKVFATRERSEKIQSFILATVDFGYEADTADDRKGEDSRDQDHIPVHPCESSQFAEVKAIQLALDIAEREKWPTLYLYTDSWMVANALWGWLQQWKQSNWQRRGKPIWAAPLWQDIAARLEKLVVKVRHVDAHVPKSQATEEHQNNQQVDQAAQTEVVRLDLDWQRKGGLFISHGGPMTPQAIKEEMEHIDGPVIEGWT